MLPTMPLLQGDGTVVGIGDNDMGTDLTAGKA